MYQFVKQLILWLVGWFDYACVHQTDSETRPVTTICCCWDADHLDPGRPGIEVEVDPSFLSTAAAKPMRAPCSSPSSK